MGKVVKLCIIVGMVVACMTGCQSYQEMLENHEAMKMQNDGIWEKRYMEQWEDEPGVKAKRTVKLSANALKDMTEEQMFAVLEYYELLSCRSFVHEFLMRGRGMLFIKKR